MSRSLFVLGFTLLFVLQLTNAHSPLHHQTNQQQRQQRTNHMSRRERLFHDVGLAISSLWSLATSPSTSMRRSSIPVAQKKRVVKRDAVNAHHQCVLKDASSLTGGSFGQSGNSSSSSSSQTQAGAGVSTKTSSHSSSSTSTTKGGKGSSTSTSSSSTPTSSYKKQFDASGSDFFDSFTFFTGADPTNGNVQFVTEQQAQSGNLISINSNNHAIMRVDTTPQVPGNRNSVRIESTSAYTEGLWIIDAVHMPTGCATWPAFWTHGPNWPANGEIDIVEGVNQNTYNQVSLHTGQVNNQACLLDPNFGGTGTLVDGTDCTASNNGNSGCGIRDPSPNSYGAGYNSNGGGVHAMLWDDTGIAVWFFDRNSIPSDITSEAPQPTGWGEPSAKFLADTCNPNTFNSQHTTIFDTTLCGDWAGGSWNSASNNGGQSCSQSTGVATCQQYVQQNGAAFSEAYWQVKSVRIYQSS